LNFPGARDYLAGTETFYAAQFQQLTVFKGGNGLLTSNKIVWKKYAVLPVKRRNHPISKAALANK
jgi:hypothetical protein